MYIIVDDRNIVTGGYASSFDREGVTTTGIDPDRVRRMAEQGQRERRRGGRGVSDRRLPGPRAFSAADPRALQGPGALPARAPLARRHAGPVRRRRRRRGAQARACARNSRPRRRHLAPQSSPESRDVTIGDLTVYFDGREVEARGEPLPLPRRERRILECLVRNRGRRLSKTQIFNAVYGIFDEDVDENVVESHISKLRKKLKHRLGYDPIDSKRFLGYCLTRPGGEI